jgi:hypothetical protein
VPDSDRERNFRRRWVMRAPKGSHRHLQAPSSRKPELLVAVCIIAEYRVPTISLACRVLCSRARPHNPARRRQSTWRITQDFARGGKRLSMPLFRGSIEAAHSANDPRDVAWAASKSLAMQPHILAGVGTTLHVGGGATAAWGRA